MALLLGEPGRMIHTMYFDGNQKTWAHRDSHYIDAQETGRMIGVWIAAEDIHPGAGPFYVYARSHRTPTPPELELDRIDPNGPGVQAADGGVRRRLRAAAGAPELKQGDMILWSSLTIHGSLATTQPTGRGARSPRTTSRPRRLISGVARRRAASGRSWSMESRSPCTAIVRAARCRPVCAGPSGCWRARRRHLPRHEGGQGRNGRPRPRA